MNAPRLLLVDDEAAAVKNLSHILRKEGYEITACQSGTVGVKELQQREFDVVLTDLRMKGVDGMALLRRAKELQPDCEVIVITGHATLDSAVEAMKEGAFHYIAKPYRLDEVRQVVKGALDVVLLKRENRALKRRIEGYEGGPNIVTQDAAMLRLLDTARQIGPTDCNVLITGESGTGKELLARYVHTHSGRANSRFVAVNCGALQEELLANELFGHEKGAFTGAGERRIGRFEQASGGTLFLDEIGEIDAATQVKILRVLGERVFERVGGNKPLAADVRLLAATNRDLAKMVAEGKFREDLFFRLNVVQLHLPPLRDRREDIPLLAVHFLREAAKENDKPFRELTSDAMKCLANYDWPGNVRELRAAVEHGVVMAGGQKITLRDLPSGIRQTAEAAPRGPLPLNLGETELSLIRRALGECRGNRTLAAGKLGISRRTLHRKLREHPELGDS